MRKIFICMLIVIASSGTVHAQFKSVDDLKKSLETTNKDTIAWTYGGIISVGMNEGFLHNWAAGGELASMTYNGIFLGYLNRLHRRNVWSNDLQMNYGLTYAFSTGFLPHKTDDRIDFTSKYGIRYDSSKNLFFAGLFNFKSQFSKGYNYTDTNWQKNPVSEFYSPAYFTAGIGMEYRKGSDVSFFISPLAGRLTVAERRYTTMTPAGAFGVPYNKTARYELGAYFSGRYAFHLSKRAEYRTRLDLYSNYLAKDTKDSTGKVVKKDNPGNIVVLFDNFLSWKLSKFLNLALGATFAYDNEIPYMPPVVTTGGTNSNKDIPGNNIGWMQIKQVFTLGLEYKF